MGEIIFGTYFVRIKNLVVSGETQTHDLSITETHARVFPLNNKATEAYFAGFS